MAKSMRASGEAAEKRKNDAVRVAVRVRPFRPIDPPGSKLCVRMAGGNTYITDPDTGKERRFDFDYSIWSHEPNQENNVSQSMVYDSIGKDLLQDILAGYHVCLFAYGQSGSGKSFSMTGPTADPEMRGLVPRMCDGIIASVNAEMKENPDVKYTLSLSMLEIYMEQLNDLLTGKSNLRAFRAPDPLAPKGPPVFQTPQLSRQTISTTEEMLAWLQTGERRRAVGATGLNERSSRAHTIFELLLERREMDKTLGKEKYRATTVRLIDLAGSERIHKSKAKGHRAREGAAINKSLTYLGLCIDLLAKATNEKNEERREQQLSKIPWHLTVLTKLLQNTLTGKAKVLMIAALCPGHRSYRETFGTLQYARQMKTVKNPEPKPEESEVDQLLKRMQQAEEENRRLMEAMNGGNPEEIARLKAELDAKREELLALKQSKNRRDGVISDDMQALLNAEKEMNRLKKELPFLSNLHVDTSLSGRIVHFMRTGETTLGNPAAAGDESVEPVNNEKAEEMEDCNVLDEAKEEKDDAAQKNDGHRFVRVPGLRIMRQHARIFMTQGPDGIQRCSIESLGEKAHLHINGRAISSGERVELRNYDRVVLGTQIFFLFVTPGGEDSELSEKYGYQFAQEELMSDEMRGFLGPGGDKGASHDLEKRLKDLQEQMARQKAEAALKDLAMRKRLEKEQMERAQITAAERAKIESELEESKKQLLEAELQRKEEEAKKQIEQERLKHEQEQKRAELELEKMRRKLEEFEADKEANESKMTTEQQEQQLAQHEILAALTEIADANDIAAALKQPVKFSLKLMSGKFGMGERDGSQLFVSVHRTDVDFTNFWHIDEFRAHMEEIRELYMVKELTGVAKVPDNPKENPFFDDSSKPVPLGESEIILSYLEMLMEIDDTTPLMNYAGEMVGSIHYEMWPHVSDDIMLECDDVKDLAKQQKYLDFDVVINRLSAMKGRYISNCHVTFCLPDFVTLQEIDPVTKEKAEETRKLHEENMYSMEYVDEYDSEDEDESKSLMSMSGLRSIRNKRATGKKTGISKSPSKSPSKPGSAGMRKSPSKPGSAGMSKSSSKASNTGIRVTGDGRTSLTKDQRKAALKPMLSTKKFSATIEEEQEDKKESEDLLLEAEEEVKFYTYFTPMCLTVTPNPEIGYRAKFRVHLDNKFAFLWCKNSTLEMEAWGSLPSNEDTEKLKQTIPALSRHLSATEQHEEKILAAVQVNKSIHNRKASSNRLSIMVADGKIMDSPTSPSNKASVLRKISAVKALARHERARSSVMLTKQQQELIQLQEQNYKLQKANDAMKQQRELQALREANENLLKELNRRRASVGEAELPHDYVNSFKGDSKPSDRSEMQGVVAGSNTAKSTSKDEKKSSVCVVQ